MQKTPLLAKVKALNAYYIPKSKKLIPIALFVKALHDHRMGLFPLNIL